MTQSIAPFLKKNTAPFLWLSLGLLLVVLFQLERMPGLFSDLWGDEIDHNFIYLAFEDTPRDLAKRIAYFMKTYPDFALKKWFWFKIFTPTELGFSLIPWIYAGSALLLVLLSPWTRLKELRLLGVLLLGLCDIERIYSVEAHYYSYVSLCGWIYFLGLGFAFAKLDKKQWNWALGLFLVSLTVGLNSHYFAWPYMFAGTLLFSIYFVQPTWSKQNRIWAWRLLAGIIAVVGTTVIVNGYSLFALLFNPPAANSEFSLNWAMAFERIPMLWGWVKVPFLLYILALILSNFHPIQWKRKLSWIVTFAVGPMFLLAILIASARSSYPLPSRYFMAYIPPLFLGFLLGLETFVLWSSNYVKKNSRLVSIPLVLGLFLYSWPLLSQVKKEAASGIDKFRSTPANYSERFEFYERVKSFNRPSLILHNLCWLSSYPGTYMRFLGTPFTGGDLQIYNVIGCETIYGDLTAGVNSFIDKHGDKGIVVVELLKSKEEIFTPPCEEGYKNLYEVQEPQSDFCRGIYSITSLQPWLKAHPKIIEETENPQPKQIQTVKHKKLRKFAASTIFYGFPIFFFGIFVYLWKKH